MDTMPGEFHQLHSPMTAAALRTWPLMLTAPLTFVPVVLVSGLTELPFVTSLHNTTHGLVDKWVPDGSQLGDTRQHDDNRSRMASDVEARHSKKETIPCTHRISMPC